MAFEDRSLTCVECGSSFVFSSDDQQYHSERGYTNDPKRCPACRETRRSERRQGMGARSGGDGMERQMYPVVCAQCGKDAEVPFRPTGTRPVYCTDCYSQYRNTSGDTGGRAYG